MVEQRLTKRDEGSLYTDYNCGKDGERGDLEKKESECGRDFTQRQRILQRLSALHLLLRRSLHLLFRCRFQLLTDDL